MKTLIYILFILSISISFSKVCYYQSFDMEKFIPLNEITKLEYVLTKELLLKGGTETYKAFKVEYDKKKIVSIRYSVFTMKKQAESKWMLKIDSSMRKVVPAVSSELFFELKYIKSISLESASCCYTEITTILNRTSLLRELFVEDFGKGLDSIVTVISILNEEEIMADRKELILSDLYSFSKKDSVKITQYYDINKVKPYGDYRDEYVMSYWIQKNEIWIHFFLQLLGVEVSLVMNDVSIVVRGAGERYFPNDYKKFKLPYVERVVGKPYDFRETDYNEGLVEW